MSQKSIVKLLEDVVRIDGEVVKIRDQVKLIKQRDIVERLKALEEKVFTGKENMGQNGGQTNAFKEMDKKLMLTL